MNAKLLTDCKVLAQTLLARLQSQTLGEDIAGDAQALQDLEGLLNHAHRCCDDIGTPVDAELQDFIDELC
jgi:hypothetical protein